jgi:hypothetical protein
VSSTTTELVIIFPPLPLVYGIMFIVFGDVMSRNWAVIKLVNGVIGNIN